MVQNLNHRRLSVRCMIHDCSCLLLFDVLWHFSQVNLHFKIKHKMYQKNGESSEIWESHKRVASHPSMAGFLTAIEVPSWDAQGHIRLPEKSRRVSCIKNTWTQLMTLMVSQFHMSLPKASLFFMFRWAGVVRILHKVTFLLYANLTKSVNDAFSSQTFAYTVTLWEVKWLKSWTSWSQDMVTQGRSSQVKLINFVLAWWLLWELSNWVQKMCGKGGPWQSLPACTYTPVSHCITRSCKFPSLFFYSLRRC